MSKSKKKEGNQGDNKNDGNKKENKQLADARANNEKLKNELKAEKDKNRASKQLKEAKEKRTPKNLVDLELVQQDISFEDPLVEKSYKDVLETLRLVENDILRKDVLREKENIPASLRKEYDNLFLLKDKFTTLSEQMQAGLSTALIRMDTAQKYITDQKLDVERYRTHVLNVNKSINEYISRSNAENARLRTLNVMQGANVKSKSGNKCVTAPHYDFQNNIYKCDTQETVLKGGFFGQKALAVENKVEEVSRKEFDKYNEFSEKYNTLYRYGGLENKELVKTVDKIDENKKYVLVSPVNIKAKRSDGTSNDRISLPLPIGTNLLPIKGGSVGSGSSFLGGNDRHKFSIDIKNLEDRTKNIINTYNIDINDLATKQIELDTKNVLEQFEL